MDFLQDYDKETILKAFRQYVEWGDECGIGADNFGETYDKYKNTIEKNNLGYVEGLMFMALEETKKVLGK